MEKKVTGAGILMFEQSTGKVLLGRRGLKGKCPNTWSPFGGTYDKKDKHPKATAIREFIEETGCNQKFQISKTPFYTDDTQLLIYHTYVGYCPLFDVTINNEHLDFDWFEIENLPENLHPGFQKMIEAKTEDITALRNHIIHN